MSDPRTIKLPRNGPKPGQSTEAWLYGKDKTSQADLERSRWQEAGRDEKKNTFKPKPTT
jgi:hypothetical protein